MTVESQTPPAPSATKPGPATSDGKKKTPVTSPSYLTFWKIDPVTVDVIVDETADQIRRARILRIIAGETLLILGLVIVMVFIAPALQPVYQYYALSPDPPPKRTPMTALTMPNMTNQAVLSWATTSITEIMTIGFGDFNPKLMAQQNRFTEEGWQAFVKTFLKQNVGDSFRSSHLVLTTVPSNTPVILWQGMNKDKVYQWIVQMPVVMTYATNNDVTKRNNAIIDLTIMRVPATRSPSGIAIAQWTTNGG